MTALRRSGQSLVEFSLVGFMLGILVLAVMEVGRMMLVYAAIANSAGAGLRYATVHGSSRAAGSAVTNASGPANNPSQVVTIVKDFAGTGALSISKLIITVNYPGGSNAPGQLVNVTVIYPYDPLTTWFPLSVRLGSTTQGVIAF